MLTRRGWFLAAGGGVLVLAGRLLGISELFALAAASSTLVIGALVYVHVSRFSLEATRELHPPRVHAGSPSRVELTVRNAGPRRSPVLGVRDPFDGGRRWARFLLAPLAPGEVARAAYRLPTETRGVFDLGPLQVHLSDPFGVAALRLPAAPATQLTVYPHVDVIPPLPFTLGHDPHSGVDHPTALGHGGEDFYALRPYEQGDDLRRVHWPSTAKTGDLMIRQDEMPWQGRATVVLDARRTVHNAASLELAVSAAASVVSAAWRQRSLIRLLSTDGVDSSFGAGTAHVDAVLEHLATIEAHRHGSLAAVLETLRREGQGGALAVVTSAGAGDDDLLRVGRLQGRYGGVVMVLFERSSYEPTARDDARRGALGRTRLVQVTRRAPFPVAWHEAVSRARQLA
jgi:uncharacterized protein (DUF58 family)